MEDAPRSIRLSEELIKRIDQNRNLRGLLGKTVSRSDVIREALEAYLPAFDDELRLIAKQLISSEKS